jgi:hypothetical protein
MFDWFDEVDMVEEMAKCGCGAQFYIARTIEELRECLARRSPSSNSSEYLHTASLIYIIVTESCLHMQTAAVASSGPDQTKRRA